MKIKIGVLALACILFVAFFSISYSDKIFEHPSVPLLDVQGKKIASGSSTPYSPRTTCGKCHNIDKITKGYHFQEGRTDGSGNIVMKDNYFGDWRDRSQSSGRHGIWSKVTNWELASKHSSKNESELALSSWRWIKECGGCHAGSGPGEFDREGKLLYNEVTKKFGYELLGKTAKDVRLDGDYADMDPFTGSVRQAPWDKSGLSGPDCLMCHRKGVFQGPLEKSRDWRQASIAAADTLKDGSGKPLPGFFAAATAGQGWFSQLQTKDGVTTLQIDYGKGIDNGNLKKAKKGEILLDGKQITGTPTDKVCWTCHSGHFSLQWFKGRDVHYKAFNRLNDNDPKNDISEDESRACITCHAGKGTHSFAKGRGFQGSQHENAWVNFRSCRDCHLKELEPGVVNKRKDPKAPAPVSAIHSRHRNGADVMSCQMCHIPSLQNVNESLFYDPTGVIWPMPPGESGRVSGYYSSDPLDPSKPDKTVIYPAFMWKTDSDGKWRLFPCTPWPSIYWGDWDKKGTPNDQSDDTILPIVNWRIQQVIMKPYSTIVTDDNKNGKKDVNRPEEILECIRALKGNDSYSRQIAKNPVLVKGPLVWYEDEKSPNGVSSFAHKGTGIPIKWHGLIYGPDHMVVPAKSAFKGKTGDAVCAQCHRSRNDGNPTEMIDRLILVDPIDVNGKPVYQTVREITGVNPK